MSLPINDACRLAETQHGWAIQRIHTRKHGRTREALEAWKDMHWFTSIEVDVLAELLLTTSDVETVAEALAEAKNVAAMLGQALHPHVEVAMRGLPMSGETCPGFTAPTQRHDTEQALPFLTSAWSDDLAMRLARFVSALGTGHGLAGFMLSQVWNHCQCSRRVGFLS